MSSFNPMEYVLELKILGYGLVSLSVLTLVLIIVTTSRAAWARHNKSLSEDPRD